MSDDKKISLVEGCQRLDDRIKANSDAMKALVAKFQSEFGPKRGFDGYMLQLRKCGKKGCTACPHAVVWRFYSWKSKILKYGERTDKLSQTFWHTRSGKTKDAFWEYHTKAEKLNAERAALTTVGRKIRMVLTHAALLG